MPQDERRPKNGRKLPQIRSFALVAAGSNLPSALGDPAETLRKSIESLAPDVGVIRAVSRFYRTPAFPAGSGPDFANAALSIETDLDAQSLLAALHAIEADSGRSRHERWAPRTLDLDLIAFEDKVLPDFETHQAWLDLPLAEQMKRTPERLILPHPRMAERAFVLIPLLDVAPDWVHPVSGLTVREMVNALPESSVSEVVAL